ncbi:MAG TPA: ABC transporter ATP-binding protein [Solirubrobacteraceae bacterium]|nr:ABC transporter ATP-binding protein [Solirubrobacteraceae bacterium]
MLELEGVCKSYRTPAEVVVALHEVSLVVEPGEVVAVLGPSGSGKSTLLELVGAMLSPDAGVVRFRGRDLGAMSERERARHRRSDVGFVFQDYNLFPGMSALENVAFPLWLNRVGWREARAQAGTLMDRVDLSHRAGFLPARLSGGERQRVAVARALAIKPSLVLADEPTGNLDTARGEQVLSALRELAQDRDTAVILVTHDARASSYADRVCELRDGCLHERVGDERLATG